MEGLIFGGAYVRREICISKSIKLACSGKEIYHFLLCFTLYSRPIPITRPRGAYIPGGDLTEGYLSYHFEGLMHGGAYVRNFTVFSQSEAQPRSGQCSAISMEFLQ